MNTKSDLTHGNTRIASDRADRVLGENQGLLEPAQLAAMAMDGVNAANENAGPTAASNLVRKSGFLIPPSLVSVHNTADSGGVLGIG